MTRGMPSAIFATAILFSISCGCGNKPLGGPPELRLGRDQCVECGMIISEDRCSSAMLIERDRRQEYVLFDDIGCMLDWRRAKLGGAVVLDEFVHDYSTRAWTAVANATFLLADPEKLVTPMSSGMVAFSSKAAQEAAQEQVGGDILEYDGLMAARKAWSDKRQTLASPP